MSRGIVPTCASSVETISAHVHVHVKMQRVAALLVKTGVFPGSDAVYPRTMTQACGSAAALVDRVLLRNAPCLLSTCT